MLIKRLLDEEKDVLSKKERAPQSAAAPPAAGSSGGGAYGSEESEAQVELEEMSSAGLAQKVLVQWYNDTQIEK